MVILAEVLQQVKENSYQYYKIKSFPLHYQQSNVISLPLDRGLVLPGMVQSKDARNWSLLYNWALRRSNSPSTLVNRTEHIYDQ